MAADPGAGLLGSLELPAALNGRGGPIVPKSMDANIFALPAPGFSSSEESSSLSDPTTDHSSSSGLTRLGRPPGPVGWVVNGDAAGGLVAWVRRWNGLVDSEDEEAADCSAASFLRNGFLVSAWGEAVSACGEVTLGGVDTGGVVGRVEEGIGALRGGDLSVSSSWLIVGVLA